MFAPTKTWRRWHRKVNVNQRRYAMCSALAGSALPALVMARGHCIENIPEVPLVVANGVESIQKTSSAVKVLKELKAYDDVEKCKDSKKIRAGKVSLTSSLLEFLFLVRIPLFVLVYLTEQIDCCDIISFLRYLMCLYSSQQ